MATPGGSVTTSTIPARTGQAAAAVSGTPVTLTAVPTSTPIAVVSTQPAHPGVPGSQPSATGTSLPTVTLSQGITGQQPAVVKHVQEVIMSPTQRIPIQGQLKTIPGQIRQVSADSLTAMPGQIRQVSADGLSASQAGQVRQVSALTAGGTPQQVTIHQVPAAKATPQSIALQQAVQQVQAQAQQQAAQRQQQIAAGANTAATTQVR